MTELDTTRAPKGVLAAQALLGAVAEQGDMAERHYLELKSTLDLSTKKDKEKMAKFILGAANRMPDVAASAFEGYGVMVVGVNKGAISGIPPVEMLEISKVIQRYVGAAGPRWDIVWVPVPDTSNQVLVVLVDPPRFGQGPFPCRASGESLIDGRIYIRVEGETREANADEVDLLVQRGAAGAQGEVDFGVEVIGEVASVTVDDARSLDEYVAHVREQLTAALPRKQASSPLSLESLSNASSYSRLDSMSAILGSAMQPETRSEDEYLGSIDDWEERLRTAWPAAVHKIAASRTGPARVRITNRTTTFFHDVEVKLHLEGGVFAVDHTKPEWADDFADLDLPDPPRVWGPRKRSLNTLGQAGMAHLYTSTPSAYLPPSINYRNGGSVTLDLTVGELRPRGAYESEDEEIVLLVSDRSLSTIRGSWELTARDHNEVYTGDILVSVAEGRDLTAAARRVLGLDTETAARG